tara:strand:- start:717 stop:1550 length:834 start_codon:yes stop_codon:yes gene_type:complete
MSASSEAKQLFIKFLPLLQKGLERSFVNKEKTGFRTSSIAIASKEYLGVAFDSQTHLLYVPPEQASLAIAVANKDPFVHTIITLFEGEYEVNPLISKILNDHMKRTGKTIHYYVFNNQGEVLHEEITETKVELLEKCKEWEVTSNVSSSENLLEEAKKGAETHFTSSSTSLYGAVVLANKTYYAGVYSAFDRRLGLHAEMVAVLSALAAGDKNIKRVAVVSTKFKEEPTHCCGCCRQFLAEIQKETNVPIEINAFSWNGKEETLLLDEYLPHSWSPQ